MTGGDPRFEQLAALDPARLDRAPAPGSSRHAEILERAMQQHDLTTDPASDPPADADPTPARSGPAEPRGRTRRPAVRRAAVLLAAAAVVLAAAAAFTVLGPEDELTPVAALTEAAEKTGDELTLRSEYRRETGEGGGVQVIRSEHHGGDVRRTFSILAPDGTERPAAPDEETFIVFIGDQGWTSADPDTPQPVEPEERNAPYAEASAAIVEAAIGPIPEKGDGPEEPVTNSTVAEIGNDDVRGDETTHYRIDLDDDAIRRLGSLPANVLSGFELEAPGQIRSLDVWVGDGYIRRVQVTHHFEPADSAGTTVEFYDFGADITITPPG